MRTSDILAIFPFTYVSLSLKPMNLLLLNPSHLSSSQNGMQRASITRPEYIAHVQTVLRAKVGDTIKLGVINGGIGTGEVAGLTSSIIAIDNIQLDQAPPAAITCTLVLALPRPKMLKRIIMHIVSMGIKELHLINAQRVEKSYWQTPLLEEEALNQQCIKALEQAKDTHMPSITLHNRFRPFVEDTLPGIIEGKAAWVAHPGSEDVCPINVDQQAVLIVGPEGGFIPFEIELLQQQSVQAVSIGERILQVETAVPALVSRLFPAQ